ncbi:MAG TPA: hypothetical protein VLD67_03420 [Vicinamibacterales bacterium]|nr:hypothetical protein [Vicinamibacterales bacterium]
MVLSIRVIAISVILVPYGAVGARQPAVRSAVPLPAPASSIAEALDLGSTDRGRMLLDVIRLTYGGTSGFLSDRTPRHALQWLPALTETASQGELVPLPLDPSTWRETLLQRNVPDSGLIAAILSDRSLAFLYYGLAALDDETLGWLGANRDTLLHLRGRAEAFAVFGRSIRVKAGRVVVPGGAEAEPVWETVLGAAPDRPVAFVRELFADRAGRRALFYDTVAHLDEPRQRFALASAQPLDERIRRVRSLMEAVRRASEGLDIEDRPFWRQQFDASMTLSLIRVNPAGEPFGPAGRQLWEGVFSRGGAAAFTNGEPAPAKGDPDSPFDAAWIVGLIHRDDVTGRRRLDTLLFAQRVFPDADGQDPAAIGTALRGFVAFPTLLLTLERAGIDSAQKLAAAAKRAHELNAIRDEGARRVAILQFQAALGIIERSARSSGLTAAEVNDRVSSLLALEVAGNGYRSRFAGWVREQLLPRLPEAGADVPDPHEHALLSAMAGVREEGTNPTIVEWEGRSYEVNPARAELRRLKQVRQRQGGLSLDEALESRGGTNRSGETPVGKGVRPPDDVALTETLTSILYAASLGDPNGPAMAAGNVALRHELSQTSGAGDRLEPWQLPTETVEGEKGWRVTGSLLGLELPLGRLALRRLDDSEIRQPKLTLMERQTAFLTVALLTPRTLTDASRDEIAAALDRGRARLGALTGDREEIERIARDAGLSEWRREALAWTAVHDRERLPSQLSVVELFWLGKPRLSDAALDPWGAAALRATGCLCLQMPRAVPWELLSGRPTNLGLLATRGADVALHVGETLAHLRMPAALAPGVVAFAMQDVVELARPSYLGDWTAFGRASAALTERQMIDYIAALAAGGPLLPVPVDDRQH